MFISHNGKTDQNMSDFIISFNLFSEYDNFDDWDAAEEEERGEYEKKKGEATQGGDSRGIEQIRG